MAPGRVALAQGSSQPPAPTAPVATDFKAPRTPWGDPDLRGTWPFNQYNAIRIPFQRAEGLGDTAWLTEEAYAARLERARESDETLAEDERTISSMSMLDWVQSSSMGRRNSLLIDPADGRLPALTAEAEAIEAAGRTTRVAGIEVEWVDDLSVWERCVTLGFPAAMLPSRESSLAVRIFQSPGFVVIHHEMMATRIVPIVRPDEAGRRWPDGTRAWMGQAIGHWEGDTLVIETRNIVAGDSASDDVALRASTPLDIRDRLPTGPHALVIERLTLLGPDRMNYDLTYADPDVFTAPWTVRLEWTRDDAYEMYEFACHEGNVAIRNIISETRARQRDRANGVIVEDIELPYPFPAG